MSSIVIVVFFALLLVEVSGAYQEIFLRVAAE